MGTVSLSSRPNTAPSGTRQKRHRPHQAALSRWPPERARTGRLDRDHGLFPHVTPSRITRTAAEHAAHALGLAGDRSARDHVSRSYRIDLRPRHRRRVALRLTGRYRGRDRGTTGGPDRRLGLGRDRAGTRTTARRRVVGSDREREARAEPALAIVLPSTGDQEMIAKYRPRPARSPLPISKTQHSVGFVVRAKLVCS